MESDHRYPTGVEMVSPQNAARVLPFPVPSETTTPACAPAHDLPDLGVAEKLGASDQRYWASLKVQLQSEALVVHDQVLDVIESRLIGRTAVAFSSGGEVSCRFVAGDLLKRDESVLKSFGASVVRFLGPVATGTVTVDVRDIKMARAGKASLRRL